MSDRPSAWPMLVPIIACLAVIAARPAERFAAGANGAPEVRWLIDDLDTAGRILRGLNAYEGRRAGRAAEPDGVEFAKFGEKLSSAAPLEPRYFLEYPHASLLFFEAVVAVKLRRLPPDLEIPDGLLDALYHNMAHYVPAKPDECILWRTFSELAQLFNILMLLALLAMMGLLRHGLGTSGSGRGPIVLLALPSVVYFTLHRFDILPSLMVLLAVSALARRRGGMAGLCLGMAIMLKAYPLILAPIFLRYFGDFSLDATGFNTLS